LKLAGEHVIPDPNPATLRFALGDTLTFVADGGKPSVTLEPGHGFSADAFESGDAPLKVEKHATFVFHCSLVLDNGAKVGWTKGSAKSGGEGQT